MYGKTNGTEARKLPTSVPESGFSPDDSDTEEAFTFDSDDVLWSPT